VIGGALAGRLLRLTFQSEKGSGVQGQERAQRSIYFCRDCVELQSIKKGSSKGQTGARAGGVDSLEVVQVQDRIPIGLQVAINGSEHGVTRRKGVRKTDLVRESR